MSIPIFNNYNERYGIHINKIGSERGEILSIEPYIHFSNLITDLIPQVENDEVLFITLFQSFSTNPPAQLNVNITDDDTGASTLLIPSIAAVNSVDVNIFNGHMTAHNFFCTKIVSFVNTINSMSIGYIIKYNKPIR